MTAISRLDDLFRHTPVTQVTLNRDTHSLVWNRKSGKDQADEATFGLLYCQRCGRTWPWMRRHQAFKNAVCQLPPQLSPPHSWVSSMQPTQHHDPPAPSSAADDIQHSPPKGMSSLSVLGVASDASHRITVFLAAPMLMMRRFHPLMFAVACGTSLRAAIPSSTTMFMMMQCHLSMLGSTESCRQVPMMCHVWGSDNMFPRSE